MPVGISLQPQGYRNLLDGFNYIVEEGIPLLVFTARENEVFDHYKKNCKADIQSFIPEPILHQEIVKTECGLVGSFWPNKLIDICEPNKLYEYIACGIPAIAVNASAAGKILEDNRIGIACGLEDVPKALKEIRKGDYRKNVQKIRTEFCMETYEPRVQEIYEQVLKEKK